MVINLTPFSLFPFPFSLIAQIKYIVGARSQFNSRGISRNAPTVVLFELTAKSCTYFSTKLRTRLANLSALSVIAKPLALAAMFCSCSGFSNH